MARNTLRRGETAGVHSTQWQKGAAPAEMSVYRFFSIPFAYLRSVVGLVRADASAPSNSLHLWCLRTAPCWIYSADARRRHGARGGGWRQSTGGGVQTVCSQKNSTKKKRFLECKKNMNEGAHVTRLSHVWWFTCHGGGGVPDSQITGWRTETNV